MTDRELLEAAAKAAGIAIQRSRLDDPMCQDLLLVERQAGSNNAIGWNPLTDDGDALRLAVKLGLRVNVFPARMEPFTEVSCVSRYFEEEHRDDAGRATRRAIVRAAAAIAESAGQVAHLQDGGAR